MSCSNTSCTMLTKRKILIIKKDEDDGNGCEIGNQCTSEKEKQ